jgi:hypothetical protein
LEKGMFLRNVTGKYDDEQAQLSLGHVLILLYHRLSPTPVVIRHSKVGDENS